MKIQIPSDVVGSPSAWAAVFWTKMPCWFAPGGGAGEGLLVDDALDEHRLRPGRCRVSGRTASDA